MHVGAYKSICITYMYIYANTYINIYCLTDGERSLQKAIKPYHQTSHWHATAR